MFSPKKSKSNPYGASKKVEATAIRFVLSRHTPYNSLSSTRATLEKNSSPSALEIIEQGVSSILLTKNKSPKELSSPEADKIMETKNG